jgi:excisionase family DNA binding protein
MTVRAAAAPPAPTRWLTIDETAELTRFSYSKIKAVIASGELRAFYPSNGRAVRIRLGDVEAFMTGGTR